MNKAFQEVLKFAEKATHEHTRGFSNRCSQCVQIRDANDPTQTTTKELELQTLRSESRHEGTPLTLSDRRSNDHECGEEGKEHLERSSQSSRKCSAQGTSFSLLPP